MCCLKPLSLGRLLHNRRWLIKEVCPSCSPLHLQHLETVPAHSRCLISICQVENSLDENQEAWFSIFKVLKGRKHKAKEKKKQFSSLRHLGISFPDFANSPLRIKTGGPQPRQARLTDLYHAAGSQLRPYYVAPNALELLAV